MQMFGIAFGTKWEHMVFNASKLNSSMLQSTRDACYCSNSKAGINYFPQDLHLYEFGWTYAQFKQLCIVKIHPGFPNAYKWWILAKIYREVFQFFHFCSWTQVDDTWAHNCHLHIWSIVFSSIIIGFFYSLFNPSWMGLNYSHSNASATI